MDTFRAWAFNTALVGAKSRDPGVAISRCCCIIKEGQARGAGSIMSRPVIQLEFRPEQKAALHQILEQYDNGLNEEAREDILENLKWAWCGLSDGGYSYITNHKQFSHHQFITRTTRLKLHQWKPFLEAVAKCLWPYPDYYKVHTDGVYFRIGLRVRNQPETIYCRFCLDWDNKGLFFAADPNNKAEEKILDKERRNDALSDDDTDDERDRAQPAGFLQGQLSDVTDIVSRLHRRIEVMENMESVLLQGGGYFTSRPPMEERNIEISLLSKTWFRGGYSRFPEGSSGDRKIVKVRFNGPQVFADLDSMWGSARVYSGDLKTVAKKKSTMYITAETNEADMEAIKRGPWLFEGANLKRILRKFTIDDIVANFNETMNSSNASDPVYRFVTYSCNDMRFTLVHKLSAWEAL